MNKRVNDTEQIMKEVKQSNERMMKTMSEQFAQLTRLNRERRTFPSKLKVNARGGSLSSFNLNDLRKVNSLSLHGWVKRLTFTCMSKM